MPGIQDRREATNEARARMVPCAWMRPEIEVRFGSLADEEHASNASYTLDGNGHCRASRFEARSGPY